MARPTPKYYSPKSPLWQGMLFLALLCALFYAALNYYAGNALHSAGDLQSLSALSAQSSASRQWGAVALERVMALRLLFSLLFCLLLGVFGHRVTGKVWPAAVVHAAAVLFMLWQDFPQEELLAHWSLALGLAGAVGLLTLVASAFAGWKSGRRKPRALRFSR